MLQHVIIEGIVAGITHSLAGEAMHGSRVIKKFKELCTNWWGSSEIPSELERIKAHEPDSAREALVRSLIVAFAESHPPSEELQQFMRDHLDSRQFRLGVDHIGSMRVATIPEGRAEVNAGTVEELVIGGGRGSSRKPAGAPKGTGKHPNEGSHSEDPGSLTLKVSGLGKSKLLLAIIILLGLLLSGILVWQHLIDASFSEQRAAAEDEREGLLALYDEALSQARSEIRSEYAFIFKLVQSRSAELPAVLEAKREVFEKRAVEILAVRLNLSPEEAWAKLNAYKRIGIPEGAMLSGELLRHLMAEGRFEEAHVEASARAGTILKDGKQSPEDSVFYLAMSGEALRSLGRPDEALSTFMTAASYCGSDERLWMDVQSRIAALASELTETEARAAVVLRLEREVLPRVRECLTGESRAIFLGNLAAALIKSGKDEDRKKAVMLLEEAKADDTEKATSGQAARLSLLGCAHQAARDWEKAIASFEASLRIDEGLVESEPLRRNIHALLLAQALFKRWHESTARILTSATSTADLVSLQDSLLPDLKRSLDLAQGALRQLDAVLPTQDARLALALYVNGKVLNEWAAEQVRKGEATTEIARTRQQSCDAFSRIIEIDRIAASATPSIEEQSSHARHKLAYAGALLYTGEVDNLKKALALLEGCELFCNRNGLAGSQLELDVANAMGVVLTTLGDHEAHYHERADSVLRTAIRSCVNSKNLHALRILAANFVKLMDQRQIEKPRQRDIFVELGVFENPEIAPESPQPTSDKK